MRSLFVRLHRWLGLATALFLFIAGATGAIISWDHELDEWLNPEFYEAQTPGTPRSALALADQLEASDARLRVRYLPLNIEAGHTLLLMVEPRVNPATGKLYELGFNQVAIDPVRGAVQAQREWGRVSLERQNLLSFLYKLHYSLHIPDGWGVELGVLFMGFIAMAWVLDTVIALWISFPNFSAWRQSFAFRWKAGGYRRIFDLHRSGGVWIFALLLILAVTSVGMNLREPVMRPIVSWFSTLTPSPFATRTPSAPERVADPAITRAQLLARAQQEAQAQQLSTPAGAIFLASSFGVYGVGLFEGDNSHGDGGLGNPWLYFDMRSGERAGADIPGRGSAGDIVMQAMFPLHSGRILGVTGRVLISLCGIAVATLCVTGVLIWARKRKGRTQSAALTGRGALVHKEPTAEPSPR